MGVTGAPYMTVLDTLKSAELSDRHAWENLAQAFREVTEFAGEHDHAC